ncbi:MAG TPA: CFI-box-CTERM domain-containing protein [Polyangia bacterium]|nr:CFI-box-CTERM domain-containing protein [Polyangia bacterium]
MARLGCVLLAICALSPLARAQMMTAPQTCTGNLMSDPIGLAFPDSTGTLQSINTAWLSFTFNKAECECATNDLAVQLQLIPSALPIGTVANNQVWVGTGCDNYTQRTTPGQISCEQVMTTDINATSFNTGAPTVNGLVNIHIPALSLISPVKHVCPSTNTTNDIYVFSIISNQQMPEGQCVLNISEQLTPPSPPVGVTAGSGDSAISLSWQSPPSTSVVPYQYQILCSDACGNPVPGQGTQTLGYSVCLNGQIHRRPLPTASSTGTTTTDDGGVATPADLGTASVGLGGLGTEASPLDGGTATTCTLPDGGVSSSTTDGGTTTCSGFNPFDTLDPKFLCSGPILASGTGGYTTRITGLTNGQTYLFTVVAIDQAGNPAAVCPVSGTPAPSEDLYRRLYADGARPHGFCFVATAAFGSYESRYVKVLRDFRDDVLMETEEGRAFVDWYYAHSPPAAAYIAEHRGARIGTQLVLWPVIGVAALWLYVPAWLKVLFCALLLGWIYRRPLARWMRQAA